MTPDIAACWAPLIRKIQQSLKGSNIILFGPPGAGKGTLAHLLKDLGYQHIGVGDLIRFHMKEKTKLSERFPLEMGDALLLPDKLACDMILSEMNQNRPFVLEGFPATLGQFHALSDFLQKAHLSATWIWLDISEKQAQERLLSRQICPECGFVSRQDISHCSICKNALTQRYDDILPLIEKRQSLFVKESLPLLELVQRKFPVWHIVEDAEGLLLQGTPL